MDGNYENVERIRELGKLGKEFRKLGIGKRGKLGNWGKNYGTWGK